jgi:regulator of sigma E protease
MVIIHEFGHFLVARFFGIRVERFSVGFGPRIWGFKRGDTDYRLSLLPLGGYVKMAGENLDEEVTGAPDEFMSKPKWQRFCVAVAGPVANILTAIAIPMTVAMIHHAVPAWLSEPPVISGIDPESPAERAQLQPGDQIVSLGGEQTQTWRDVSDKVLLSAEMELPVEVIRSGERKTFTLKVGVDPSSREKIGEAGFSPDLGPNARIVVTAVMEGSAAAIAGLQPGDQIVGVNGKPVPQNVSGGLRIVRTIKGSNGQPVTLDVKRNDAVVGITATPQLTNGQYLLGFNQDILDQDVIVTRLGPIAAFNYSIDTNLRIIRLTGTILGDVFSGRRSFGDTISGPVGIFEMTGQAAKQGTSSVFGLMAMLSLNLGLINLLPIPVLDGGLIFMLLLESLLGLFGLPLTLKIKERMMQVGFVVIVLLMAFVFYSDIAKRIPGRSSSPPQTEPQPPGNK